MNQHHRISALLLRRLRLDLRQVVGHLVRMLAGAMLLFTIYVVVQSNFPTGAPGLTVFRWVVWFDSLLISGASITVFASIISAEREQGTLSLVRMTGMSPFALLLGQGFSGVVIGCLLLVVQFPFVVLTITLGGVLWSQVLATFLALLAHLVLTAGIGLFWSVLCLRSTSASFWTLLTQFLLWLGTYFARWGLSGLSSQGYVSLATQTAVDSATMWIDERLVWTRLTSIASSYGVESILGPQFWWSIGAGLAFIGAGAWLLDRRPFEVAARSPIVIRLWKSSGNRAWSLLPIAGKDYRQFMGGWKSLVARVILYPLIPGFVVWLFIRFGGSTLTGDEVATTFFWFASVFLTIECAAVAARVFRNELAEMTWSSLAVLPRWRPWTILEKLCGCGFGLLPGVLICLVIAACSEDVRRFASGVNDDETCLMLILLTQPVLWCTVTGVAALFLIGVSPTVTIFLGFVAIMVQYFLSAMLTLLVTSARFVDFTKIYLIWTWSQCLFCLLVAAVRLRKLTAKD